MNRDRPHDVALADFTPDRHLPLLRRWLADARVARWWGDAESVLAVVQGANAARGAHAMIAAGGREVGYVCWQSLTARELAEVGVVVPDDGSVDVDLMIGEDSVRGTGVGTAAMVLLLARLRDVGAHERAVVFTSVENAAARRCFEKAGFVPAARYVDTAGGEFVVMFHALGTPGRARS